MKRKGAWMSPNPRREGYNSQCSAVRADAVRDGAVRAGAVLDGAVHDGVVRDGAVRAGAVLDGAVSAGAVLEDLESEADQPALPLVS